MKQKSIVTEKGTELPVLDLHGKAYLLVAHRLVWFRERCPNWGIETCLIEKGADYAVFKACIKDETGRIIAEAHKFEEKKGFGDYREKAETGAIGRALALCGFGTQFSGELDEGSRIVDSPLQKSKTGFGTGEYRITCWKRFNGKTLSEVPSEELSGFLDWMESDKCTKPLTDSLKELKFEIEKYLDFMHTPMGTNQDSEPPF